MMSSILQDIRFGFRFLRRDTGTTAIAILTLAVGVGANIALFSVVNAVLFRSLPFRDPDRLVFLHETNPQVPKFGLSYPDYKDWREQTTSFQEMAGYSFRDHDNLVLMRNGEPFRIVGALISHNLFSVIGIQPVLGRSLVPEDEQPGKDQVVLLSHHLWEQRFDSDAGIVGGSIEIDGKPFTVIGVMSERDQFPENVDIWLPLSRLGQQDFANRSRRSIWVIARLKPGVTEQQSFAELQSLAQQLEEMYPEADKNVGPVQTSLLNYYIGDTRKILLVLLGAASLVMLIACGNVANLLLARSMNRKKEIAIRAACGATRPRLFRQLLTEGLLLASAGAAGGVLVAFIAILLLNRWASAITKIPRLDETSIDSAVFIYAAAVAIFTGLVFGTLPAFQGSQIDLSNTLKEGGRRTQGAMHGLLRNLLIVAEVAIAVTVLIGTGLLVKSLGRLLVVDPGFRTDALLTVQLSLPRSRYPEYSKVKMFYQQLLERVNALPGVSGAATINILHIVPSLGLMHFGVEGMPPQQLSQYPVAQTRNVSAGYFQLMNIPIRVGRSFEESDLAPGAQRSFIINESLARRYFPGEDPIGKKLLVVEAAKPFAVPIVGVAADVKDIGVDKAPEPEVYSVGFWYNEVLLVHASGDPLSLTSAIRGEVQALDPYQPVGEVRTMQNVVDESLGQRKLLAGLMALFSGLALVLAAIGIYGVISYSVVQRTPEIGVRMALGASRKDIIGLLLRQGMMPVMIGLVAGLIGAWSLRRVVAGLLYDISSTDILTYIAVAALIVLTALLATLVPTQRATRIDPYAVIRQE